MKSTRQIWTPLFSTQLLGVLNDHILKNSIIFIGILWLPIEQKATVISVASAFLVLPFVLLSPAAGKWAQERSKRKIFILAKLLEIPIMLVAAAGFMMQNIYIVMAALLLMGAQSAMNSPSKFGLIRDIGGTKGLSFGVGTMEMLSFFGVLIGQLIAGYISDLDQNSEAIASGLLIVLAIAGWFASKTIKVEEQEPAKVDDSVNFVIFLYRSFKWAKGLPGLNYTVFGLACFWLAAALIQMNVLVHAPETYGLSNTQTAIIMSLIAVGIGFGCWVAGMIANDRVEVGMAPIGGLGLSICMTIFALFELSLTPFIIILSIAAFFSGFFKVPLGAWIQERVEGRKLGSIIAYTNMVTFLFILISAGIFAVCMKFGNTYTVFAVIAVVAWIMTFVTSFKIPAMLIRFLADTLARIYFRYEVEGKENIPKRSGALLVANHISLMDFLMIVATIPRQVRFVVAKDVYDFWAWRWLTKRMNLIPIETKGGRDRLQAFNDACQKEINEGHIVVIYPEGQISRIGHLLEFKKGVEHIAKGIDAPIIPVHLEGTEGTFFSYEIGSSSPIKSLKGFRKRIHVSIGEPADPSSKAFHLRQSVVEMSAQAIEKRFADEHTLALFLKDTAKELGNLTCTQFQNGEVITVKELALEALKWKRLWLKKNFQKIGILLPKTKESMLANASMVLAGKISININPDFTDEQLKPIVLESEIVLCEEDQRARIEALGGACLILSDLLQEVEIESDLSSLPGNINKIGPGKEIKTTDTATIIYQFDEENRLVRIPLSHMNVMAGIKGLLLVNKFQGGAKMLGLMPFHTSNGYILDLCMSTFIGVQNFHFDPAKGPQAIVDQMKAQQVDIFVGNRSLIESVDAADPTVWKGVSTLISGEEKLSNELRNRLKETFDLEVRESLHALRSGTLIALNTPDYTVQGVVGRPMVQEGSNDDSLGRPIPGLAIRTVDEADFDHVLDEDQIGRILIKGAAVTSLLDPSLYYKGWLDTGRRGYIDEAGFVHLAEDNMVLRT